MASATVELFPAELVPELISQVKGSSAIAQIAAQTPISFTGNTYMTFNMDKEVDLVAENGAKSEGGISLNTLTITPVKIEYGARVSDEFMIASEERKIDILSAFSEGFAKKVGRGLDIMALHGLNPRTGTAATALASNNFDAVVTNSVAYDTSTNPDVQIEDAIALIDEGYDLTGMMMSRTFATAMGQLKTGTDYNSRLYPDFAFGGSPTSFAGTPLAINSTVSEGGAAHFYAGDFSSAFKWGYSKEITTRLIEYGDPDNSGVDLAGHNQVYIRAEMYLGWGILIPSAFTKIAVSST